jgi:hypothetical protein
VEQSLLPKPISKNAVSRRGITSTRLAFLTKGARFDAAVFLSTGWKSGSECGAKSFCPQDASGASCAKHSIMRLNDPAQREYRFPFL